MIAHRLVRVRQEPGCVLQGRGARTLAGIVPAQHADRRLRHTLAGNVIGPPRRGDRHAIGEPGLRHGHKDMRPEPIAHAIATLFDFPPARLALLRRGAVAIDNLPHLLARFQDNIERLTEGHGHLDGHARGIVVDFLGGPGRDFRGARGAGLGRAAPAARARGRSRWRGPRPSGPRAAGAARRPGTRRPATPRATSGPAVHTRILLSSVGRARRP